MKLNKNITLLCTSALLLGATILTISSSRQSLVKGLDVNYTTTLDKDNGKAISLTKKNQTLNVKTNLNQDLKVDYKSVTPIDNTIGRVNLNGYYMLSTPIWGISSLSIDYSGNGIIYFGPTSTYFTDSETLSGSHNETFTVNNHNYFKVVASDSDGILINSINIEYTCSGSNAIIMIDSDDTVKTTGFYSVSKDSNGFIFTKESAMNTAKAVIIPDYYNDGVDYGLVHSLAKNGTKYFFEGCTNLEHVYLPETLKTLGGFYTTTSHITEFTLPRDLEDASSYPLPINSLETLNIHSRNLTSCGSVISSSKPLRTINISYDVESLPDLVSSWHSDLVINYEGTMDEFLTLAISASSAKWNTNRTVPVVCSDGTTPKN